MKGPDGYSELQVSVLSLGAEMSEEDHSLSAIDVPKWNYAFFRLGIYASELKA